MKIRLAAMLAASAGAILAATGPAGAQDSGAMHSTIKQRGGVSFKPNRYVKSKLRWDRDVYTVSSGGKLTVIANVVEEGPHTFTLVKKSDLPKSFNCKVCDKLGKAHGADPESDAPPKFAFLEDGTGTNSAPSIDRPGDSAFVEPKKRVALTVTAPAGSTLYFVCLIHPWMQAKVLVK